jgi:hypothetical protein
VSVRDELLAQLEFYWDHNLWPRLRGLTDEEYFWEPVPGCWSVRRRDDGTWSMDWEWPTPVPAPVTTIAWRLAHMGIQTLGIRASALFGDGSLTIDTVRWPRTASEALRALATHYEHWRRGVRAHQPADEDSFTTLILHMNRELIHYGAEVGLMRDLFRSGRRVPAQAPAPASS